jgi:hypothetical protein
MARAAFLARAIICRRLSAYRPSFATAKARGDPVCQVYSGPSGWAGGATLENALIPPPRPRAFYVPFDAVAASAVSRDKSLADLGFGKTVG